ncbi:exosortase A [Undibacterium sp. Ren11W]|uniref:exosortase A n=1 Tax=Undibacterium sp. Ren11W TaxID=3413045 RepID=UPI003BF18232
MKFYKKGFALTQTKSSFYLKSIVIAFALLAPFFVYFSTAKSIVGIWNTSETFAHGYIILPISLWLIWRRRDLILGMRPQTCWPLLPALAACGFAWLLAELADVQVVRQYMFVLMIALSAVVVLGWRIAWAMAFPLFFLIFAVPFGEIFLAPLINFTANFTVTALQFSGIPVLREGNSFTIPSGSWSVVEACSGLRYLISSLTLGSLYAYLTYRATYKRVLFIVFSIIVPIIANGLRAYMIVMIGHFSGMTLAVGVDHLIYGWLFFGLVMFFMFWIGSFWREDAVATSPLLTPPTAIESAPVAQIVLAALSVLVCMGLWPAYAAYINRANQNFPPVQIEQFQSDWQEIAPFSKWKPDFFPAHTELDRAYQNKTQVLGMHLGYYRNQARSAGLISSVNQLVKHHENEWREVSSELRMERIGTRVLQVRESRLRGNFDTLLVWQWYWIDGQAVVNLYEGKMLQAKEKLLMRGDDGAALFFYASFQDNPEPARETLRNFLKTNLENLELKLNQSQSFNAK